MPLTLGADGPLDVAELLVLLPLEGAPLPLDVECLLEAVSLPALVSDGVDCTGDCLTPSTHVPCSV